ATLDADRLADYFGAPGPISPSLNIPAPIILVDGQNYPVEAIYDPLIYSAVHPYRVNDKSVRCPNLHPLAAALKVKQIVERREMGDILVFLPGQVTEVEKYMLPESVRAKVPEDKPWTPGDELMQDWLASQN
ncbi:hypothetical protein AAVH_40199, partial [Aphelenchoides avenae]